MGKDEGLWGRWCQGNVHWHWGCAESGWERDFKVHKGWDLCLCGGGGCGSGVGGDGGVDCSDGGYEDGSVDGSGGNSGVGECGESGMYRSGGGGRNGGSIVHRSVGGGLCGSGWYFGVRCGFCGGGGGGSGTGGGVGCETCCEAGSVVCEWERISFELL